jgi:hypothetical protein
MPGHLVVGIAAAGKEVADKGRRFVWTEDMFIRAIREKRQMGQSRPILPPMPAHVFRNMTDDDLKAIWAFLRTLPPVVNHVPDPVINEALAPWTSGQMKTGT